MTNIENQYYLSCKCHYNKNKNNSYKLIVWEYLEIKTAGEQNELIIDNKFTDREYTMFK